MRINFNTLALLSAVLVSAPSCGSDENGENGGAGDGDSSAGDGDNTAGGDGDGDGNGGGTGSGGNSGSGSSGTVGDGDASGGGMSIATPFEACAVDAIEAEARPADIFFMIDQSISMIDHTVPDNDDSAPTRWDVLRDAVMEFIEDDASAGLRVAAVVRVRGRLSACST